MGATLSAAKPEIMAPAGDWICLRAALDAGCDAVYFGIQGLNMRARAENFTAADMKKVVRLCRVHGARAYLALNTIIYESEIKTITAILSKAAAAGVDAVICWDFAVIQAAADRGLPVHLSTQMSVANSRAIGFFFQNLGIRRYVLARECSLDDVKKIKKNILQTLGPEAGRVEIEVFAHGALCVSISGRCFLSEHHYGKSANRGECTQPCRREYDISAKDEDLGFTLGSSYILSPKDLCTLPFIEKLLNAGVASLKIEGRNRSPEYVSVVTGAYRRAVDFYSANRRKKGFKTAFEELKQVLLNNLQNVYHRGFSSGFYMGKPVSQWADGPGSRARVRKEYVGVVTKHYRKPGVTEIKVESNEFCVGDEIMFQGKTTGTFCQTASSLEVNHRKIKAAHKGALVALKTDRITRKNDQVYVVRTNRQAGE